MTSAGALIRFYTTTIIFLGYLLGSSVGFAAQSTNHNRAFIVTGANGYVGREIVHTLTKDDATKDDCILCLVREHRVEEEASYWKDQKADNVAVMPYDMLDGGETLRSALQRASEMTIGSGGEGADQKENDGSTKGSANCRTCLLHVASNFGPSENHSDTALKNVKGAEDVVRICADFPDTRLVLTSSTAAVRGTGQPPLNGKAYTHLDWNTKSELGLNWGNSYQWSKAESERRAWALSKELGVDMVSLCPSFIFGPSTDGRFESGSYSITLVRQWVNGESEVQSRLCVDVRDIALAHVRAGITDTAVGKRILVSAERRLPSNELAEVLKGVSPNPDKIYYDAVFDGGAIKIGDQEVECLDRLKEELGIVPRSAQETFHDMAAQLVP